MDLTLEIKNVQKRKTGHNIRKNPLYRKFVIPNHTFRAAFVGPSQSGKTNLLMNLLTTPYYYFNFFDRLIIFTPSWDTDEIYRKLEQKYERKSLRTEIEVYKTMNMEAIDEIMQQQEQAIQKVGLFKAPATLIVFDDMIGEKETQDKRFMNLYFRGRHLGISTALTSQSYKKIPRSVRLNLSNMFFFSPGFEEAKQIAIEQRNSLISEKDLAKLIMEYTRKKYSFFHINKQVDLELQFRANLDTIIEIVST
jgi:hypothetical protein